MTIVVVIGLIGCAAIIAIGARFLLQPAPATTAFGVPEGDVRALTAIKGVRDVTSGIVPLVVLLVGGREVFGAALVAAALTPLGDLSIVLSRGGSKSAAFGIHGATVLVLVVVGLVLTLS